MSSTHSPRPHCAANDNDHALRSTPMSTRRRRTSDPIKSRREALRKFDIHCNCKCSLIVSCAIGTEPGCRERRRDGVCGCKSRWLPSCILDAKTPHGCKVWQEGHQCSCKRLSMPRCLVTGCDARRKGRRCECPRTPTEVCQHVLALGRHKLLVNMTPEKAEAYAAGWMKLQRQVDPQAYNEPKQADAGAYMGDRETAIATMTVRVYAGRSPWHPDDWGLTNRRRLRQEEQRRTEGMAAGFLALLYAMRRKGGRNGRS